MQYVHNSKTKRKYQHSVVFDRIAKHCWNQIVATFRIHIRFYYFLRRLFMIQSNFGNTLSAISHLKLNTSVGFGSRVYWASFGGLSSATMTLIERQISKLFFATTQKIEYCKQIEFWISFWVPKCVIRSRLANKIKSKLQTHSASFELSLLLLLLLLHFCPY